MNQQAQLIALFFSALTSATILPGTSDAALMWLVHHLPELKHSAFITATLGNSLGSLLSYGMGRMLPEKMQQRLSAAGVQNLQRWGVPLLLFSWVPLVGDALPLAAGWLRLSFWRSALLITLGKAARYAVLIYLVQVLAN
ncbi:YqaA family protein [Neisseriaceae bacterium B1]